MNSLKNGSKIDTLTNAEAEKDVLAALASLQLPHMPEPISQDNAGDQGEKGSSSPSSRNLPSITILVCADIDLKSSSALAEYTLQQKNRVFDASAIDMIIAAGPCTRGDSDLNYYSSQGASDNHYPFSQQQHQQQRGGTAWKARRRMTHPQSHADSKQRSKEVCSTDNDAMTTDYRNSHAMSPFFRSREESAGLEGLLTASISQLESIVCRVVYCPGWHDPLTLLQNHHGTAATASASASLSLQQQRLLPKRLTTNSRNIHQQWLPIAPGLGCAGLFYLDGTDALLADTNNDSNDTRNDDDSEASEEQDSLTIIMEQAKRLQCSSSYTDTLSKLLQLAPKSGHPEILFASNASSTTSKSQSILVTHYVDCRSLIQHDDENNVGIQANGTDKGRKSDSPSITGPQSMSPQSLPLTNATPWPLDHDNFMRSDVAQQHLCFEIACGSAVNIAPEWIRNRHCNESSASSAECANDALRSRVNDTSSDKESRQAKESFPVLLPGSLRERGEFSIVQLSLVEQNMPSKSRHVPKPRKRFAWAVQNVDFHHINNFGQRTCH